MSSKSQDSKHSPDASDAVGLCVAVVGATGAVGEVLMDVLVARGVPVREFRALASPRSVGRKVVFGDQLCIVQEAKAENFVGADLVFFAATGGLSAELAPAAVKAGAIVIDKSSTWRMHEEVPLVVPEINAHALDDHSGIIANPNCTTTGVVMALEPIRRAAGLSRVVVTTMQAVSGAGREGMDELADQLKADAEGRPPQADIFVAPMAGNVVPFCGGALDNDYTDEEMKLVNETRKILGLPELEVAVTCVRVPVPVGHSSSLLVDTDRPISPEEASSALAAFPGVAVHSEQDAEKVPTPRAIAGQDTIVVGRIRKDLASDRLALWQVGDNLRKGAATNAVQIAESLIERKLLGAKCGPRP